MAPTNGQMEKLIGNQTQFTVINGLIGSASLVSGRATALSTWNRPAEIMNRPNREWNRPLGAKNQPDEGVNRPNGTNNRPDGEINRQPGTIQTPKGINWFLPACLEPVNPLRKAENDVKKPLASCI